MLPSWRPSFGVREGTSCWLTCMLQGCVSAPWRHDLVLDPYGHVRQAIIAARQGSYGAVQSPPGGRKGGRKRAHKPKSPRAGPASPDRDGDINLPSAESSPENEPRAKEARAQHPTMHSPPSGARVQQSGQRLHQL